MTRTRICDIFGQMDTVRFTANGGGTPYIALGYNPSGERVYKKYYSWHKDRCGVLDMVLGGESELLGTDGSGGGGGLPIDSCWFADTTQVYYVRGGGKVLAEYENPRLPGSPKAKYIFAGDRRIAMINAQGQLFFYLNDHLGSARVVFTEVNDTVVIYDQHYYLAYGRDWPGGSSTTTNQAYKYTGQPYDNDAGLDLYYYGARYYDADLGRFVAVDPLANKYPGWGPYVYTLGNPIRFVDPDGRDVVVLNDSEGAYGAGHNAVIVGNDDDGWTYFSYDGDNEYTTESFDSYSDYEKSDVAKRYDRSVRFTTTTEQDSKAKTQGTAETKKERDGSVFQILNDNCAHVVRNTAGQADIIMPDRTIPNRQYDDAKKEKQKRDEAKKKKAESTKQHDPKQIEEADSN